ncbi:MAG: signal peptidase II [Bacilli bacterium]|nr:signal peptidase II [Bacilli bacterium]
MKNKKVLVLIIIGIILDRISKIIISINLKENQVIKVIGNFFRISYMKNTGAAWSMLEGKQLLLIIISILFLIFMIMTVIKDKRNTKFNILGYSFIIGGIIGNLIDRIIYKYVIDFLSFKIINYYFPVFNIADMLIVFGAIFFISDILLEGREEGPIAVEYKEFEEKVHGKNSSRKRKS